MAVAGAVGTYMYMTKKMPNSVMTTNKYYLVGIVLLGAVFSAYTSSYIKSKVSKPTSK